jgi:hypothetical protein
MQCHGCKLEDCGIVGCVTIQLDMALSAQWPGVVILNRFLASMPRGLIFQLVKTRLHVIEAIAVAFPANVWPNVPPVWAQTSQRNVNSIRSV